MKTLHLLQLISFVVTAPLVAKPSVPMNSLPFGGKIDSSTLQSTVVNRPPIKPFKAFPLVDLVTGKPLKPSDIISVGSFKGAAETYYAQLNEQEYRLNERGFTLRSESDLEILANLSLDMDPIKDAATYQVTLDLDFDPLIMEKIKDFKLVRDDIEKKSRDIENQILRGFESLASSDDPKGFQVALGPLDKGVEVLPTTEKLSGDTHKEWAFGPQENGAIGVNGKAIFHIGNSKTKAEILASAKADGMILAQPFNLLYAKLYGKGEASFPEDKAKGALSAEVYLNVLGMERFKWAAKKDVWTYYKPDLLMPDKKKAPVASGSDAAAATTATVADGVPTQPGASSQIEAGAIKEADGTLKKEGNAISEWLVASGELLKLEPWSYPVQQKWVWYFMVGPLPGNGAIGIDGKAYVDWGAGINVNGAKANLTFGTSASVWASGAVGVEVLQAGVYSNLLLIDNKFTFEGSSVLSINVSTDMSKITDTAVQIYENKEPIEVKIITQIKGHRHLAYLSGKVGAYAEVPMPKVTPPFYEKKRFEYVAFEWPGFNKSGDIFSFKKVNKIGKYEVFGALGKDDQDSAQLDKSLDDLFHSIMDDEANHENAIKLNSSSLARNKLLNQEFKLMVDSIQ